MKFPNIGAIVLIFFALFIFYYSLFPNNYEIENCTKHSGIIASINHNTTNRNDRHWEITLRHNPNRFKISGNAYSCVDHQLIRKEFKTGYRIDLYCLQEAQLKLIEHWNASNNVYEVLEVRKNDDRLLKIEEVKEKCEIQAVPWSFLALGFLVCAGWILKRQKKK